MLFTTGQVIIMIGQAVLVIGLILAFGSGDAAQERPYFWQRRPLPQRRRWR